MEQAEQSGRTEVQDVASGPLAGIRVIELGEWMAVPLAGKMLADLGAVVTKIERPGGDRTRQLGPFAAGQHLDLNGSALFAHLNSSKRSVVVTGGTTVLEIARVLDETAPDVVLVDQYFLGSDARAEITALGELWPLAVIVSVTPFGLGGSYAGYSGYDITAAASGGISCGIGEPNRAPLPLPYGQSEQQAGICAAIAAVMGVLAARRDQRGDHVDLSTQEVLAALHCGYFLPRYLFGGGVVGLRSGRVGGAQPYPNTVLHCRDGLVAIIAPKIDQWRRFLALMGEPEWSKVPRYRDRRAMQWEYKDEVDALIEPWFRERTKAELSELFLQHRIPFAPVLTGLDLASSAHLLERKAIHTVELPNGTPVILPTVPYRFSRSVWRSRRAPQLGEHGMIDATASADVGTVKLAPPIPAPEHAFAPLHGLRVLDLGTAWAGGLAGRILGDCGADVVKVESWTHMDGSRLGRPIVVDDAEGGDAGQWPDLQPGFHVHGRSKRSITLNLHSEQGRQLLLQLAARADVLIHNFPPRTVESLGITPDVLRANAGQLIVVGQSVAGASGPLRDYTGYASTVAALGGLLQGIGYAGEEPIASFEGIYTDVVSAITTVFATVAALVERATSQRGQAVDVSQWEATLALASVPLAEFALTGATSGAEGFTHSLLCPHGNYPARPVSPDDDPPGGTWLSVAAGTPSEWCALLAQIDPTGALGAAAAGWDVDSRRRHLDKIDPLLLEWLGSVDVETAQDRLQRSGVPAFRVLTIADIFVDVQLEERGTYISVEHPNVGVEPMPGLPWNYARTRCTVSRRAPLLGEHSFEVLHDQLGIDSRRFAELVDGGVVETGPNRSGLTSVRTAS